VANLEGQDADGVMVDLHWRRLVGGTAVESATALEVNRARGALGPSMANGDA
jgi:hypothetical protein